MTVTELIVIVGGLVLGYWIVSVLLPTLGRNRDDDAGAEDTRPRDDAESGDPETVVAETKSRDESPVRREM